MLVLKRRYATLTCCTGAGPWTEVHGYHQSSLRDGLEFESGSWSDKDGRVEFQSTASAVPEGSHGLQSMDNSRHECRRVATVEQGRLNSCDRFLCLGIFSARLLNHASSKAATRGPFGEKRPL